MSPPVTDGVRRSIALLANFRHEQSDPARHYESLARDTVAQIAPHVELAGTAVVDIGGGPGYTAEAFRDAGCDLAVTVDPVVAELRLHGRRPIDAVAADGLRLPFGDRRFDVVCTSNTLEHVARPWALLAELVRVTRAGGTIFVAVTNWLSPWGGHETSPWHYLGGERAAQRYRAKHGVEPKNRYGMSLFEVHVGQVLRWAEACPDVDVLDARPRYYPAWARPLVQVPALREVATWNLAVILRRHTVHTSDEERT